MGFRKTLPGIGLCLLLAFLSYGLAQLPLLKLLGPLTLALLAGLIARAIWGLPDRFAPGTRWTAKPLLRWGIVLMGARLEWALIAQAGPQLLGLDLVLITLGIGGVLGFAKLMGIPGRLPWLLAVGTGICGASAAVAAGTVSKASDEEVTLAVALCGILGTSAVFILILLSPWLGLSTAQLGILAGSSLHEVAQVMAASLTWGSEAGDTALVVKLTRVVMLAPVLLFLGALLGQQGRLRYSWKEPPIPWFVLGFMLVGLVAGFLPNAVKSGLATASVFLMTMAMGAMGLQTPWQMLRQAGLRIVYAGALGFGIMALTSLILIGQLHLG